MVLALTIASKGKITDGDGALRGCVQLRYVVRIRQSAILHVQTHRPIEAFDLLQQM